jgi:hypothetical protein
MSRLSSFRRTLLGEIDGIFESKDIPLPRSAPAPQPAKRVSPRRLADPKFTIANPLADKENVMPANGPTEISKNGVTFYPTRELPESLRSIGNVSPCKQREDTASTKAQTLMQIICKGCVL